MAEPKVAIIMSTTRAMRFGEKPARWIHSIAATRGDNPRIPAVLKNALDYSYRERNRKGVAFVGYGGVGAARAIDQLRLVCVELQMVPTRTGAHFQGGDFLAVWQKGKDITELFGSREERTRHPRRASMVGERAHGRACNPSAAPPVAA